MTGIPSIEPYPLPSAGELPANTAQWTIDWDRAVLLVHDMQRYFLRPLPATVHRELLTNAVALRGHCAARGVPVAYTAQSGDMNQQDRGLLNDFWGTGMRATAADRQVTDDLAPAAGDQVFTKWRYSAFFRSRLLSWMREQDRDQLILCGVYAHIGVLATALDAFTHDIRTFFVADATANFSPQHHHMALSYAADRCAMVMTTKEITG